MTDKEYHQQCALLFSEIETLLDEKEADFESNDNIIEIDVDNGQIIINKQAPMHEVWLACKEGGFHFHFQDGQWKNTRGGDDFIVHLQTLLS